jgi:hypothetical protein
MKVFILFVVSCAALLGQEDSREPKLQPAVKTGMKYYVSLPQGWNRSRKWPVVMTIDGSGQELGGQCEELCQRP